MGQREDGARSRSVSVVAAARLLADERCSLSGVRVREKLRSRGKRLAVDQNENFATRRRLAGLLYPPVGVFYHSVLAIGLPFHHLGRQCVLPRAILLKSELQAVENQVVIILKRLVDEEGKEQLAEFIRPATVIAQIKDQRAALLLVDLAKRFADVPIQVLVVGLAAEPIDLQVRDHAVVEERQRGRVFRTLLAEFGGFYPLKSYGMLAVLLGVPERDRVGALQAKKID